MLWSFSSVMIILWELLGFRSESLETLRLNYIYCQALEACVVTAKVPWDGLCLTFTKLFHLHWHVKLYEPLLLFILLYYLFTLAVLGLHCCSGFSLIVARRGYSFTCGTPASCCLGFPCCRGWALGRVGLSGCSMWPSGCGSQIQQHRLSSRGSQA